MVMSIETGVFEFAQELRSITCGSPIDSYAAIALKDVPAHVEQVRGRLYLPDDRDDSERPRRARSRSRAWDVFALYGRLMGVCFRAI